MPAVKWLFQSMSNTKPARIMGHSLQAVSMLAHAGATFMAVPLAARIHEGIVACNATKRTLLDKMLTLVDSLELKEPFYFVADAYYASGKIIKALGAGQSPHNSHAIECRGVRATSACEGQAGPSPEVR
jgi:hypothetical protein